MVVAFIAAMVCVERGELCLHLLPMVRGGPLSAFHVDMSNLPMCRFAKFATAFTFDSRFGTGLLTFTRCTVKSGDDISAVLTG